MNSDPDRGDQELALAANSVRVLKFAQSARILAKRVCYMVRICYFFSHVGRIVADFAGNLAAASEFIGILAEMWRF